MRPAPVLIVLAALAVLGSSRSWSQPASAPASSEPKARPAAHVLVGAFARLAVVFRTFLAPATTNLDGLDATGSLLTIPAPTHATPAPTDEQDLGGKALWPVADHICSSPQTCCQIHGGIWMDGRCH